MSTVEIPLRLDPVQRKILLLIEARRDAGLAPPTIDELAEQLGGSRGGILCHAQSLRDAGMLTDPPIGRRSLVLTEKAGAFLFISSTVRLCSVAGCGSVIR